MKESFKISATDAYPLAVTSFSPRRPNGRVVVINSATGVKQNYYEDFANWLSDQGYRVYTYDYRGIGLSLNGKIKDVHAHMHEWGTIDYHSVLRYVFSNHSDTQVVVIGHSVGGQIIGMSPLSENVDFFVMVGAQTPFWKNFNTEFSKSKLFAFWHITIPVLTKLFGYFPAKKLGLFENLPAGVALQWSRWARSKNYIFDELPYLKERFTALQQPSLMISFDDDPYAPKSAVEQLMRFFRNIKWSHWHIRPDDILQQEIGHFGFFRKKMAPAFWGEVLNWMNKPLQIKENKAA